MQQQIVLELLDDVAPLVGTISPRMLVVAHSITDAGRLADFVAGELPLTILQRQSVLQTIDQGSRLDLVSTLLRKEHSRMVAVPGISVTPDPPVDIVGGEARIPVVERQLEDAIGIVGDTDRLRAHLEAANLPQAVSERANEELERLDFLPAGTPDYAVVRTYLQWLASLPWHGAVERAPELATAAAILDTNHYGLRKVKDRILEQLAVYQLAAADASGPILCFVGPPGVGKTSLGRSMAAALGRPFVRVALGGVHDEAEIRGHRRTYVNALPGRILRAMREAGTLNPVFMLDEIDKLGLDLRGDPLAALLEVLDPEQNRCFNDHYLDVPYDLSHVTWVTTANSLEDVEDALLDRLEVIELAGYSEDEKIAIAQQFLVPRQIVANGLAKHPITFSTATIRQIARTYTYEAGVRALERELGAICRKVTRRIVEGRHYPRRLTPAQLPAFLGPERYDYGRSLTEDEVGVATGMVWTEHGGDIIVVEIAVIEGKGNLLLTGHLGEIMQESAQAALSYTRTNARRLGIDPRRFEKVDIHVHIPEGNVPKDGPSAGITVVCALVSALTGRKLKRNVALTGEVTLRGRVLPVGGIREKVLGAYRAGITTVVVPAKNERELHADLPPIVRRKIASTFVSTLDEVFPVAFAENPLDFPWKPRKRVSSAKPKVKPESEEA
ncbi:MAG: endopeptidase La [Herpetosiphon sp.]